MNITFGTVATVGLTADRFESARRDGRMLGPLFVQLTPKDVPAGYRVQAELARRAGSVAGWKVSFLTQAAQAAQGVDRPLAARLYGPYVQASPARLRYGFIAPVLECEFAFVLGRDLPPRVAPYTREEVEAAIAAVRPGIEIVDPRINKPAAPMLLCDAIGNAGYVFGAAFADWKSIDYAAATMTLSINGAVEATGSGKAILDGDLVQAVVLLANNQPPDCEGLKQGQFITTGTCSGVTRVERGDLAVADFGALGRVEIGFDS